MRNILLRLAFDGTAYAGWQKQKEQPTVQGKVEDKLALITAGPVILHGAGRTDAGVHALAMTAGFETASAIPCAGIVRALNSLLPEDIRVLAADEMAPGFHARISARGKAYVYRILVGGICPPTRRLYNHHLKHRLRIEPMRECLEALRGRHDFSCFEATGSRDPEFTGGRGAVRNIFRTELIEGQGIPLPLDIEIAGDGFLRHMVRNIVGTLLEVGAGRMGVDEFQAVLAGRDRSAAGPTAPARGLFLKEVYY
ncbi:MAG: tRNA pseudouridine(38-40) synthase TruA [Desulfurivibrionaceae bacterium]